MLTESFFPIGVFDSGYGGLTILKEIVQKLPQYDYVYLGDNARTPYGNRSFETVYHYTLEAVKWFFSQNCHLIILACNTASAKALRTIQQRDLPLLAPLKRVLGVIRPSVEAVEKFTITQNIGILGTVGTVLSNSYPLEIQKLFPHLTVTQESCPMWVPLVENNEHKNEGANYFVQKNIENLFQKNSKIDTVILGCTHYPLLVDKILKFLPQNVHLLSQGEIVAKSLEDYLFRHPEIENFCSKNQKREFFTTETVELFEKQATLFFEEKVSAKRISLGYSEVKIL